MPSTRKGGFNGRSNTTASIRFRNCLDDRRLPALFARHFPHSAFQNLDRAAPQSHIIVAVDLCNTASSRGPGSNQHAVSPCGDCA